MEHSKKFYESVIRVIDHLEDGNTSVSCEKGYELAGYYWPAVVDLFKERHAVSVFTGGHILVTRDQYLDPLYEDCKNKIAVIEKAEDDRNIDRKYKIKGILFGGWGLGISILSLLISIITLLSQLGILKLLAK